MLPSYFAYFELNTGHWLLFLILWPMIGGVISFVSGRFNKCLRDCVAAGVTLVELAVTIFLAVNFATGTGAANIIAFDLSGFAGLGLHLTLDGFRLVYAIIIAFMWSVATIFSHEYLGVGGFKESAFKPVLDPVPEPAHSEHDHGHGHVHRNRNRYHMFVLFTLGSIMGVFLSSDLYTTFVFFELMSLFSYIMVVQDETPDAMYAASTYLAIAILGGMVTLFGLVLLHNQIGTLVIQDLYTAAQVFTSADPTNKIKLYVSAGLTFVGFAAKAAVWPMHIWLPTAHTAAPAPSSALLSGLLTKSGLFGILAISSCLLMHDPFWGFVLLPLALINMLLGAVLAIFSVNLKRTLACSSMSQIGFIMTGVAMQCIMGVDNELAVRGTILYMIGHSLIKLVLFLCAGAVQMNTGHLELNKVRGFGRGKPLFLFIFAMGALGLVGMPLWNGYLGKTLIHESIVEHIEHLHHLAAHGHMSEALSILPAVFTSIISEAQLFQIVEWLFLISGGLTAAYVTKLSIVLFFVKPVATGNDQGQTHADSSHLPHLLHAAHARWISPIGAFVLTLSAVILPLLGALPYLLADPIAKISVSFMNGEFHHKIAYFSLANLKGAATSLAIGAMVYLLIIRTLLMRQEHDGRLVCLDLWPRWLSIERALFRPVLVKVLPFLGALVARTVNLIFAGPVNAILSRATSVQFLRHPEDQDFGLYASQDENVRGPLVPASLTYGLTALIIGLFFALTYASI